MTTLFLFAAGGESAEPLLRRFVEQGFARSTALAYGFDDRMVAGELPPGRLHLWSTGDTRLAWTAWTRLVPGDVGFGYAQGRFRFAVRLAGRTYSPEFSSAVSDESDGRHRPLLSFFDHVEPLDVDRRSVVSLLGYDPRFVPRSSLFIPRRAHQLDELAPELDGRDLPGIVSWVRSAPEAVPIEREDRTFLSSPSRSIGSPAKRPHRERTDRRPPVNAGRLPVSYARLDAPTTTAVGQPFIVKIGLADRPGATSSGEVKRPIGQTAYAMTVELVAPDFEVLPDSGGAPDVQVAADGGPMRFKLQVTRSSPFPAAEITLQARVPAHPGSEPRSTLLQVLYSVGGTTVGFAAHPMTVVAKSSGVPEEPPLSPPPLPVVLPNETDRPDITVRILKSSSPNLLIWTTETAWPDLSGTPGGREIDIGEKPGTFAKTLIDGVEDRKERADLRLYLQGIGRRIGGLVPNEFWDVLEAVHDRVGDRNPTILLLTADPFIPWELATVPVPAVSAAPPWLAAQAAVGRWPLIGSQRPAAPVGETTAVADSTVVSGTYDPPLVYAREEAEHLIATYRASPVTATLNPLVAFLESGAPSELVHFAVHGSYEPDGPDNGLFLADGTVLSPETVLGATLSRRPFVFLNACQVGTGEKVLGDYAGLAAAFLQASASGVVAPLWSVDDFLAKEIATDFYASAFSGEPPAEFFRRQRGLADGRTDTQTYLAYQFFGHPRHRISRV